MDNGWGAFLIAVILGGACYWMEWRDKRRGKYPRDWED